MRKVFKWLAAAFFAFVVLLVLIGKSAPPSASPAAKESAVTSTTAQEMARAYEANSIAADQRFKGQRLRVTGQVSSIGTDLFGSPYVTLTGGVNQFLEPQFEFPKAAAAQLASLGKGNTVTLECVGAGDIAKKAMAKDCALR